MQKGCGGAGTTTPELGRETRDLGTEQRPVWPKGVTEDHEGCERWLGKEAEAQSGRTLQAAIRAVDFAQGVSTKA